MQLSKGAAQVVRKPYGLRAGRKVALSSFAADLRSRDEGAHLQASAIVLDGRQAERDPGGQQSQQFRFPCQPCGGGRVVRNESQAVARQTRDPAPVALFQPNLGWRNVQSGARSQRG